MARSLDGVVSEKKIFQYVEEHQINLTNFHPEILTQYSLETLWSERIDKNVEYFNLKKEIDLLVLARKIKVIDAEERNEHDEQTE